MSARHSATASSPKSLASAIIAKTNWGGHGFLHCPGAKFVQARDARQLIGRCPPQPRDVVLRGAQNVRGRRASPAVLEEVLQVARQRLVHLALIAGRGVNRLVVQGVPVQAHGRLVARPRGALVHGHVEELRPSCSALHVQIMPSIGVAVIVAGGAALARAS
jgi:hypothetical protein